MTNKKQDKLENLKIHIQRGLREVKRTQERIRSMAFDAKQRRSDLVRLAEDFNLNKDSEIQMYSEITDESKDIEYVQDFKLEGRKHPFFSVDGLVEVGIDFKDDIRTIQGAVTKLIKLVDPSADLY